MNNQNIPVTFEQVKAIQEAVEGEGGWVYSTTRVNLAHTNEPVQAAVWRDNNEYVLDIRAGSISQNIVLTAEQLLCVVSDIVRDAAGLGLRKEVKDNA